MVRLLALEWNESEARVVVGGLHKSEAFIEQAFVVPLPGTGSEEGPGPSEVGQQIAAALSARGIRRLDTVVGIGRASIELRHLTLPPAPDDELPDMVRFQALREFNALQEDWPLDFIPLDDDPNQARNVLAAAIAPELVEQIQQTCQTAGLRVRRLVLRPCGAASLFCRRQAESLPKVCLLVDLLADETDLTVVVDRKVIFLRTARLPADPLTDPESAQALLGELRRTMAAVSNQLGGRRVELLALCGTGPLHAALADQLAARLGTPTELFDPFAGLRLEGPLRQQLPEQPGRFAPLLGMLVDELEGAGHSLDFLHPRRRPPPPSRVKRYAPAGLAAAVLVAALGGYSWLDAARKDQRIASLQAEVQKWENQAQKVAKLQKVAAEIRAWQAGDVVWLDELRWLSEKLPPAQNAMITRLQAAAAPRGGGEIELEGLVQPPVVTIKQIEQSLRDATHRFVSKDTADSTSTKNYSQQFKSVVQITAEPRR